MCARAFLLFVLSSVCQACGSGRARHETDAARVGLDASGGTCTCAATEFCCVGTCLPFGSTCPPSDASASLPSDGGAASIDGALGVCDRDPHALGAMRIRAACASTTSTIACDSRRTGACNVSFPDCHEWVDPDSHELTAGCLAAHHAPCEPARVGQVYCEGALLLACASSDVPPTALALVTDCRERVGMDGRCVSAQDGGLPHCESPTAMTCDPGSFVPRCTDDHAGRLVCQEPESIVVPSACGADLRCFESSVATAPCLPSSAVPSSRAATTDRVALACVDAATIRYAQFGYEWTQTCDPELRLLPDGTEEHVATVCYDGFGGVRCVTPDTEHCDPATYTRHCGPAPRTWTLCSGGDVVHADCDLRVGPSGMLVDGVCDPDTGTCVPPEGCAAGFWTDRCVARDSAVMTCDFDAHQAFAHACAHGCVVGACLP